MPARQILRFCLYTALSAASSASQGAETLTKPKDQEEQAAEAPLDYQTLSHTISIRSLRAGSHDPGGKNKYFFETKLFALLNSPEERNAPFEKRKKLDVDLGTFGDTEIDSLAVWKPDEKLKNFKELKVDGNIIRELAARAMTEFNATEDNIAIMVEISMLINGKKFMFFGENSLVAKATHFPIPQTKFEHPLRSDESLKITDTKGTLVILDVRYDVKK